MREPLSRWAFVWLGNISYSMYLLHPVCIAGAVYLSSFSASPLVQIPVVLLAIPLTLLAANLANRYVEQPGIRIGRMLTHRSLTNAPAGAR